MNLLNFCNFLGGGGEHTLLASMQINPCLMQTLMHVKNTIPRKCKRGAVYEILCGNCDTVYIREMGHSILGNTNMQ